jgi:DNA-directed RNA polymerase alpha subunit
VFAFNQMRESVDIENAGQCNLCNECVKYVNVDLDMGRNPEYKDLNENWENMIRIGEKDNKFIFTIESTGALSPEDIVLKAFVVLRTKLQLLKDAM